MPRERRVEYAGAIYHVMARGDGEEDIVLDDTDRRRFVETLEEVVRSSGWTLYAWVLMGNHYHFLFKTPQPNLVRGMSWFQNTWTRRFNSRHNFLGALFGGRYKAKPVEEGDYLTRLIHYIHLNPVRAGLVTKRRGVGSYPWSSFPDYLQPPRKRRDWVAVDRSLQHVELPDTATGRRRFLEWTEDCVDWKDCSQAGEALPDGQSLQSTFQRGWYFGTEPFREKLLGLLGKGHRGSSAKRQKGNQSKKVRDHGITEANRIIEVAERELGLQPEDWAHLKKGDWRKGVIAALIRERSLIENAWLAERLQMGARNAVSRIIRQGREDLKEDRKARRLGQSIRKNVDL